MWSQEEKFQSAIRCQLAQKKQITDRGSEILKQIPQENGKACLLTLTDRKSRFLICRKLDKKNSECMKNAMIEALTGQPLFSITPDRGKEFSQHSEVTKELNVEFYFPPPHHPWERGTNENTNGLLREYFPKGQDLTNICNEYLQTKKMFRLQNSGRNLFFYFVALHLTIQAQKIYFAQNVFSKLIAERHCVN